MDEIHQADLRADARQSEHVEAQAALFFVGDGAENRFDSEPDGRLRWNHPHSAEVAW